ncbi:MAG: transcriptional regulatory protein UpxY-like protein [bacterium P3]|nr:MAG: transcriptional regulatory protein UpxY-like protein [bacterium P3]KWW32166.1 MAG: transcriptional regulatory protein UpxY-like protein [bacterium F083]
MGEAVHTLNWYAARTRYGQELGVRDRLEKAGVEHFIPTRRVRKSRGKATFEKPVINNLVFLRATKREACALANEGGLPVRYIVDCATRSLLVVPDKQMEDFRRVLDLDTDGGGLMDRPLALGDRVRVVKGALRGVEGRVLEFQGRVYVVVGLMESLFAKARVPRAWLEKVGQ